MFRRRKHWKTLMYGGMCREANYFLRFMASCSMFYQGTDINFPSLEYCTYIVVFVTRLRPLFIWHPDQSAKADFNLSNIYQPLNNETSSFKMWLNLLMLFTADIIILCETGLLQPIFIRHSRYWLPDALASGNQWPQCWGWSHVFPADYWLIRLYKHTRNVAFGS